MLFPPFFWFLGRHCQWRGKEIRLSCVFLYHNIFSSFLSSLPSSLDGDPFVSPTYGESNLYIPPFSLISFLNFYIT